MGLTLFNDSHYGVDVAVSKCAAAGTQNTHGAAVEQPLLARGVRWPTPWLHTAMQTLRVAQAE